MSEEEYKKGDLVKIIAANCDWNGDCVTKGNTCIGSLGIMVEQIHDIGYFTDIHGTCGDDDLMNYGGKVYKIKRVDEEGYCIHRENEIRLATEKEHDRYYLMKYRDA